MKQRNGFVANSSTTVFVCWGVELTEAQVEYLGVLYEKGSPDWYEVHDKASRVLEVFTDDYDTIVGLHPGGMELDETLSEYKDRVLKKIREFYPDVSGPVEFYVREEYE